MTIHERILLVATSLYEAGFWMRIFVVQKEEDM